MTFIYNSAPASNSLAARVQVYKDGRAVISMPSQAITVDKQNDPQRIPFKAKVNLAGLQAGRYVLEVTVEDRAAQKSASQRVPFYMRQRY
jgi:hypothetical protein